MKTHYESVIKDKNQTIQKIEEKKLSTEMIKEKGVHIDDKLKTAVNEKNEVNNKYKTVLNENKEIITENNNLKKKVEDLEKMEKLRNLIVESQKEEIITQKQLIDEVSEKNLLLKEQIKRENKSMKSTFSGILKSNKKTTIVPTIEIKKKEGSNCDILEKVNMQLNKNIIVPIDKINKELNGEINIKCSKMEDVQKTIEKLVE